MKNSEKDDIPMSAML